MAGIVTINERLCAHHWLVATPDGREWLPAVCKLCGEERQYLAAEPVLGAAETWSLSKRAKSKNILLGGKADKSYVYAKEKGTR